MKEIEAEQQFLAGGGAMGERLRAFPWASHVLGHPREWPQGLRTAVRIMLTTQHPIFVFWGPEHICLYNDAYSRSLGSEKHPEILGAPGRDSWEEIWPVIGPQLEHVLAGKGATWHKDQRLPIVRHGGIEEAYWTYSYSPIDDPDAPNGVGGVLVICTETTAHVQTEAKLSEEIAGFVQLFDQAPTFLAVLEGPDHVIKFANPGYLKLVNGRSVVGRRVVDALPEAAAQGYVERLDEVYRSGRPYSARAATYVGRASPGGTNDERHLDFVYQPMTGMDGEVTGILVQGVDVTDRVASERAAAINRSRLDYATRLSGVGFWYCNLPFDVLEWDDRVKEHFFFPPTARITIDDFYGRIHPEDRTSTREAIEASINSRNAYDIVYRTVCPGTSDMKWIRALGGTDCSKDGTPVYFDGVTVDVSEQKLDQQRLSVLNQRLLEQDRRKDVFIATLSHELRNPLAPIRSAAKVLASPKLAPTQLRRVQAIIERQVTHMALLLDDLLDIARITQGKLKLKKQAVALVEVVDAAVEAVRPSLDAKNHRLSLMLPTEAVSLEPDPVRLAQIVSNLLTNAGKYSPPGSHIEVAAVTEGETLVLSVKDNGIGIAVESLEGIFDMFSQIDGVTGMSDGGLGIGLALVKGLTELHGGTVEARSGGIGEGSSFVVRLPLVRLVPSPVAGEPGLHDAVRRKILVVDDNEDAAESLAMLFELAGHEVRVANSARAALALAQLFRPDTALLDVGLPDLSGYELARLLRLEPWAGSLQLIALTGWAQENDRRQASAAGFDHHLSKPVDTDQLDRLIGAADGHNMAR